MPELLTAEELIAEVFGSKTKMSPDKLYRLAKKQRIPSIRLDGMVFFPLSEFRAWVKAESKVSNTAIVLKNYGRLRAVSE